MNLAMITAFVCLLLMRWLQKRFLTSVLQFEFDFGFEKSFLLTRNYIYKKANSCALILLNTVLQTNKRLSNNEAFRTTGGLA